MGKYIRSIVCILLSITMCFAMSVTVLAKYNEISFPMVLNTGFVGFENMTTASTNFASSIPIDDSIILRTNGNELTVTKVALLVEGERHSRNYSEKVEYNFLNYTDANCTQTATAEGKYWKLDLFANTTYSGGFLVSSFTRIDSITLATEAYCKTEDEKFYNSFGNTNQIYPTGRVFTVISDFTSSTELTNIISELASTATDYTFTYKEVYLDYPILVTTDQNNDGIVSCTEIERLSYSELGEGKGVKGFEGLASQVAAFFNKQTNGKITFKLTTAPSTIVSDWNNGGIPAYSNGIFASSVNADNLIGLFFNYENTGSLVSASKINADGTITFDISNVLTDIGGNTLSTLKSVYYGMIGGINYTGFTTKGIKVESVILSYDGETTDEVETVIIVEDESKDGEIGVETPVEAEDEDDEEEVVVPDEDDEEVEPVEEVVITDDETDDATIIDERTVEEEPIIEEIVEDIDSENPHTGVALVVMPTLILGIGALALSRKRK